MTLLRVKKSEGGGDYLVVNLQLVARALCSGFERGQEHHKATLVFADGGMVELLGEDADRAMSAWEDFAGYPHLNSP